MKKRSIICLLMVTVVFVAVLISFYIGRNTGRSPIIVSTLPEMTQGDSLQTDVRININTADSAQLQKLPGIGEVIAQRIIDYRTENGPFQDVLEITMVKGIGAERLEQIRDLITVG